MAKELPYFKFEPNMWDNGNIQICDQRSKGLFIDICSMYWTRLGELPYALALQKHCKGEAKLIKPLLDSEVILIENDQIIIEFLDEQLNEFQETSEKRRQSANKRWSNASAMQKQCKSNAIREEKIRGNKIKVDKEKDFEKFKIIREKFYSNSNLHISWCRQIGLTSEQLKKAIFDFFEECHAKEDIYRDQLEYKSYCFNWIKKNQSKYLLK